MRRNDLLPHGLGRQPVPEAVHVEQLRREPRILFLADGLCLGRRVPPRHARASSQPRLHTIPIRSAPAVTLLLSGPVNTNKGKIKGFEAQIRTFFDWAFGSRAGRMRSVSTPTSRYIDAHAVFNILQDPVHNNPGSRSTADPRRVQVDLQRHRHVRARPAVACACPTTGARSYPEGPIRQSMAATRCRGSPIRPRGWTCRPATTSPTSSRSSPTGPTFSPHPFQSDIVRRNYSSAGAHVRRPKCSRWWSGIEETVLSGGIRFNFAGHKRLAPPPPPRHASAATAACATPVRGAAGTPATAAPRSSGTRTGRLIALRVARPVADPYGWPA